MSIVASVCPAFTMIADVDKPFGDIAVHPRIDRRLVPRRGLAGKRERLASAGERPTVTTSTVGGSAASWRVASASRASAVVFSWLTNRKPRPSASAMTTKTAQDAPSRSARKRVALTASVAAWSGRRRRRGREFRWVLHRDPGLQRGFILATSAAAARREKSGAVRTPGAAFDKRRERTSASPLWRTAARR